MLYFWCQARNDNSYLKLSLILPSDVKDLPCQLLAEEEVEPVAQHPLTAEMEGDMTADVVATQAPTGVEDHSPPINVWRRTSQ